MFIFQIVASIKVKRALWYNVHATLQMESHKIIPLVSIKRRGENNANLRRYAGIDKRQLKLI